MSIVCSLLVFQHCVEFGTRQARHVMARGACPGLFEAPFYWIFFLSGTGSVTIPAVTAGEGRRPTP